MPKVLRIAKDRKIEEVDEQLGELGDVDVMVTLIQALIPLGFRAAEALLLQEVNTLAGPRYARDDGASHRVRWGRQRGSIYLADQKLPIQVPRVRDRQTRTEVPLETYARFQQPRAADESVLRRLLYGLSCRGLSRVRRSGPGGIRPEPLQPLPPVHPGDGPQAASAPGAAIGRYDFAALVLDGKVFGDDTFGHGAGVDAARRKDRPGVRANRDRERDRLRGFSPAARDARPAR